MTESLPPIDLENEVTVKIYASAAGISVSAATVRLKKLVKSGKLTSRKVKLEDGHQCTAYRKVT
jgi:DNA-binding Lrp family transcriptional regulator